MAEPEKPRPAAPQKTPGSVRPLGARPLGPIAPKIYTPGSAPPKPEAAASATPETEGMKAHRREIERKKRDAASERVQLMEEAEEGWARVRRIIVVIAILIGAALVYLKLQLEYQNKWPLFTVWILMALALGLSLSWLFWYMNKD